jgi:hypothetical protein
VQKEKDDKFAADMGERYARFAFEAKKLGLID